MMHGERVLVPLRGVFEKMGARVQWKADEREVVVSTGDKRIELKLGSATAKVNGEDLAMDTEALLTNGRTMVPLRFVAESLGAGVTWRANERRVTITPHR